MPPAKSTAKVPAFASAAPPRRMREPALSREAAEALRDAINDAADGWVTDGNTYDEPREGHRATQEYRSTLSFYGLMPEGKTLGGRVVDGRLYLTWRDRREPRTK